MRAVTMTGFDAAPALTDLDVPEPKEGEVRVRIRAASVNGFDLAVAAGYTKDYMEHRFPLVLGKDFAGEVDALGAGVTGYAVGDRVFGTVTKPYLGDGSFAEYVTVPIAVGLAPLPESISFTDAAALGLAGAAAYGIIDEATLEPGHIVLVVGATGGVGNQVVQLAAAAGARVIATAHTDAERELVTRLGAQATVDHTGDLTSQVARFRRMPGPLVDCRPARSTLRYPCRPTSPGTGRSPRQQRPAIAAMALATDSQNVARASRSVGFGRLARSRGAAAPRGSTRRPHECSWPRRRAPRPAHRRTSLKLLHAVGHAGEHKDPQRPRSSLTAVWPNASSAGTRTGVSPCLRGGQDFQCFRTTWGVSLGARALPGACGLGLGVIVG